MEHRVKVRSIGPEDYLRLTPEIIAESFRDDDAIVVVACEVPQLKWNLFMLISPAGYCWGMQYQLPLQISRWQSDEFQRVNLKAEICDLLEGIGLEADLVRAGLVKYHGIAGNPPLEFGEGLSALSSQWVRVEVFPLVDGALTRFVRLIDRHLEDLGKFFLLKHVGDLIPDLGGAGMHPRLSELFYDPPGRMLLKPEAMAMQLENLRNSASSLDVVEADGWLSPSFLEGEYIRPAYPLPIGPTRVKKSALLTFIGGADSDVQEYRRQKSLLRIGILRTLGWPVGTRLLAKQSLDASYRRMMLGPSKAWEPLEQAVADLLSSSRERYKVLFEE